MQVKTISEQMFFTTVRIDTLDASGIYGSGTGFYFNYRTKQDEVNYRFIVTNKHVVANMREGYICFLKHNNGLPSLGDCFRFRYTEEQWNDMWFGHPDQSVDIVITPLQPIINDMRENHKTDPLVIWVGSELVPNSQQIQELDAIESITFIGYPNGLWDSKNFLPIARRGTTASPIEVDFEGSPCFLIDASVFGGSSGSPVFLFNQGGYSDKNGSFFTNTRVLFLGVIARVFFRKQYGQILSVPIPTMTHSMIEQQEMLDLGIVYKASTVIETVEAFLKSKGVDFVKKTT